MKTILILFFIFYTTNSFEVNKKVLKIFLIEINPILYSIRNTTLYKSNNGHPYVSEFLSHDRERALNEIIEDLEFGSHGQLKIDIVNHALLNEFPKYTTIIDLPNGKSDYKFDEETYVSVTRSPTEDDKGIWFRFYHNKLYDAPGLFNFDYEYIIQKYNLVYLKNNKRFDHVWILGIDPLSTFETIMVGSDPYWINGTPIQKDCKNFMIAAFTISRRDANLHALAHGIENLINYAFKGTYIKYNVQYNDYTQKDYEALSYWEKFTLIDNCSQGHNSGVGNVHFPFNGVSDYDYSNDNKVYSYWENWLHYPYLNGTKNKSNNKAWITFPGNYKILKDSSQNQEPQRLYMRFWMYLFPHIEGYTEDGYLNNWWDYYTNIDYVTSINTKNKNIIGYIGEELELNYYVYYRSGEVENIKYAKQDKNVQINGNCIKFENNKLIGAQKGDCSVSIFRDGKSVSFSVNIMDSTNNFMAKFLE